MTLRVYKNVKSRNTIVVDKDGNEVELDKRAKRIINRAGPGGDVDVGEVLEILGYGNKS